MVQELSHAMDILNCNSGSGFLFWRMKEFNGMNTRPRTHLMLVSLNVSHWFWTHLIYLYRCSLKLLKYYVGCTDFYFHCLTCQVLSKSLQVIFSGSGPKKLAQIYPRCPFVDKSSKDRLD